ncbi:MAG: hypothetical protein IJZ87_08845 [Bacteroidales bacterium]|nr:hypothetical protein [Bacteroidales bacterium]
MKKLFLNITLLLLTIITLNLCSCSDVSKSYCNEILNDSFLGNDSLSENETVIVNKCSEKYHKKPIFLQKAAQIYYIDAINDYSDGHYLQSASKLFQSLQNINLYFSKIDEIKPYDYKFRGEIYERLGDVYKDINSLKPAIELYDKALSDYEESDNNEKVLNMLLKMGKLYQYNQIPNIALIYFEMAEEKDEIPNNIYRKIIDNKIVTLYELNDYKNADSIFKNHFNVKIQDYDFHSAMGTIYFYDRNYEKALPHLLYCFENGNQQEKLVLSEKLAEAYFNLNDHENEMIYIQHQAKNNSFEIRMTPLKLELEKLFDTNRNIISSDLKEENNNNTYLTIILIVLTCAIIFIILFNIRNKKSFQEKIRNAEETINVNNETIQSKDEIIDNISKKLVDLESKKVNESFEDAYNRFYESRIYTKIKSLFEGVTVLTKNVQDYSKLALSNKDITLLIKTFNNCFPNAISSIKKCYEAITPSDIKFIILYFMNMNDAEIAVLLELTYGAANKRSNKIKNIFNTKDDLNTFLTKHIKSNF